MRLGIQGSGTNEIVYVVTQFVGTTV